MRTKAKIKPTRKSNSRRIAARTRRAPRSHIVNVVNDAGNHLPPRNETGNALPSAAADGNATLESTLARIAKPADANRILELAAVGIIAQATRRGQTAGERSMDRAVEAFNALTGNLISVHDGWLFMAVLNAARAAGGGVRQLDDYLKGAAYFALAGESADPRKVGA